MRTRFFLSLALAAAIFTAQPAFSQNTTELFRQGNAAREARNFSASAQIFRTIISLEPNNAGAYTNLGLALHSQGNLAEAINNYRTAIRLDPNLAIAYNNLGIALDAQGNRAEAITNYRTAIRIDPSNPFAYSNLGAILYAQGNLSEAINNYRTSLRLNQNRNPSERSLMTNTQNNLRLAEQRLAEQQRRR